MIRSDSVKELRVSCCRFEFKLALRLVEKCGAEILNVSRSYFLCEVPLVRFQLLRYIEKSGGSGKSASILFHIKEYAP